MTDSFTYVDPSGEYDVTRQIVTDIRCLRVTIRSRKFRSISLSKDIPMQSIMSTMWPDIMIRDEVARLSPSLREAVTEAMVYEAMGASGEV